MKLTRRRGLSELGFCLTTSSCRAVAEQADLSDEIQAQTTLYIRFTFPSSSMCMDATGRHVLIRRQASETISHQHQVVDPICLCLITSHNRGCTYKDPHSCPSGMWVLCKQSWAGKTHLRRSCLNDKPEPAKPKQTRLCLVTQGFKDLVCMQTELLLECLTFQAVCAVMTMGLSPGGITPRPGSAFLPATVACAVICTG